MTGRRLERSDRAGQQAQRGLAPDRPRLPASRQVAGPNHDDVIRGEPDAPRGAPPPGRAYLDRNRAWVRFGSDRKGR